MFYLSVVMTINTTEGRAEIKVDVTAARHVHPGLVRTAHHRIPTTQQGSRYQGSTTTLLLTAAEMQLTYSSNTITLAFVEIVVVEYLLKVKYVNMRQCD